MVQWYWDEWMVVMTVYVLPILYMVHVTRMSVVTSSILVTSMAVKLSNQWVYIYIYHTWCVPSRVMTGRSRAVPAAAPPSARLPAAAPGQEPPERHAVPPGAAERFLQIDRPVPARRPGRNRLGRAVPANGSCPTAGQEPPRSGGSCAGAGQQPPHHSLLGAAPPLCGRFLSIESILLLYHHIVILGEK